MSVNLASMAWRNLWRNKRRTIVTLSSIAFGILLAVLFTGMGDDSWTKAIDLAARMGSGHVTIMHPDYLEAPSLKKTITNVKAKRELASKAADIEQTVTRILGQTMLATANGSYGALFIAYDPAEEDVATFALLDADVLAEGAMFESANDKGIILGRKLADNLDTKLGRKVVYTMTDKNGEIVSDLARVKGIIKTGSSMDAAICLLPLGRVRDNLGYGPDESLQIAVFLADHRDSDAVASSLMTSLDAKAVALPWHKVSPDLAAFIAMKVGGTVFLEIIILILVAAGIFNTLFVSVMERMREFGIMMAIGFSPSRLFRLVMWESLWLACVGLISSAAITAGPYYYYHTHGMDFTKMMGGGSAEIAGVALDPIFYVTIFPESAFYICLAVMIATLVSGLYPAWRAGRVVPVETIKLV
ncbi:MAG: FtsX-like permease family protein [Pseudomonadota bacterium]